MKSHQFAMFVSNFTTIILSIAEIIAFFYKKDGRKLPSPKLPKTHHSLMLTYALPILTSPLSVYVIFA